MWGCCENAGEEIYLKTLSRWKSQYQPKMFS